MESEIVMQKKSSGAEQQDKVKCSPSKLLLRVYVQGWYLISGNLRAGRYKIGKKEKSRCNAKRCEAIRYDVMRCAALDHKQLNETAEMLFQPFTSRFKAQTRYIQTDNASQVTLWPGEE
jgi:hypothetical protein